MSNPTSSDTDPTTLVATSVVAPAQKCYMVVTPSVLNSNGTRDLDGNDIKWFVKFGDGEGEPQSGRYVTHNPDYESVIFVSADSCATYRIQTNNKGRAGTELKREVFERRGFKTSVRHGRSEWFILWERPDRQPPIKLSKKLTQAIDAFAHYDLGTAAGREAAIKDLKEKIPPECKAAP